MAFGARFNHKHNLENRNYVRFMQNIQETLVSLNDDSICSICVKIETLLIFWNSAHKNNNCLFLWNVNKDGNRVFISAYNVKENLASINSVQQFTNMVLWEKKRRDKNIRNRVITTFSQYSESTHKASGLRLKRSYNWWMMYSIISCSLMLKWDRNGQFWLNAAHFWLNNCNGRMWLHRQALL